MTTGWFESDSLVSGEYVFVRPPTCLYGDSSHVFLYNIYVDLLSYFLVGAATNTIPLPQTFQQIYIYIFEEEYIVKVI